MYLDDHEDSLAAEILLRVLAYFMVLSIPFSITLYLARNFARINKKLIRQVDEIQELSDKNLQQEKEKQEILEEQNLVLESRVQERTQELAGKNKEILIKNREITDNLTYARRIQAALLPEALEMKSAFKECFVLYLPKDIVSGDFYAFFRKDNRLLVAVADCTGHGVSGAFMSMIGSSLLSQIINIRNLVRPSEILEALNEEIIVSLNQRSGDSNDGMDIALISYDPVERTVEFAGANRPMWLIRNGELTVYRPDKFPIGGLQVVKEQHFKNNSISVLPGDCIYLFSDGFADQFGGEQGKKLMTKRLKNLILENSTMPMDEQEQFFFSFIQEWRGGNEQLDDILMMGIRI
jgi:serine phosphatase RsbU (regulator of sigma subunit)